MGIRATGDQCGIRVARDTTLIYSLCSFLLWLLFTNLTDISGDVSQEIELPPNVEIKGVFGCNLELFQSDVDLCFRRRQLVDN